MVLCYFHIPFTQKEVSVAHNWHVILKVTQKTAWFMLHRIRHNIKDDDATFDDMTQVDETYVGGKTKTK